MREFDKMKALLVNNPKYGRDEDEWELTKKDAQILGGKLSDVRRRKRNLSGHVDELEHVLDDIISSNNIEIESFDVESFKADAEKSVTLTSYPLFNNAPYSDDKSSKNLNSFLKPNITGTPISTSPIPPSDNEETHGRGYFRGRDTTATELSQDEMEQYSSIQKKKKKGQNVARQKTISMSSDTDGEMDDMESMYMNEKRKSTIEFKKKAVKEREEMLKSEEVIYHTNTNSYGLQDTELDEESNIDDLDENMNKNEEQKQKN